MRGHWDNSLEFIMAGTSTIRVTRFSFVRCNGFKLRRRAFKICISDANHPLPHSIHVGRVRRVEYPGALVVFMINFYLRICCVASAFITGSSEICSSGPFMAMKHLRQLTRLTAFMVSITSMCTARVLIQVNIMAHRLLSVCPPV